MLRNVERELDKLTQSYKFLENKHEIKENFYKFTEDIRDIKRFLQELWNQKPSNTYNNMDVNRGATQN
jgi:hypothetical protein